uniref:Uncharacterized protein n=1 Tax=Oryza nivara TaxID=4536 RepID=A0A0E0ID81_ORYNI
MRGRLPLSPSHRVIAVLLGLLRLAPSPVEGGKFGVVAPSSPSAAAAARLSLPSASRRRQPDSPRRICTYSPCWVLAVTCLHEGMELATLSHDMISLSHNCCNMLPRLLVFRHNGAGGCGGGDEVEGSGGGSGGRVEAEVGERWRLWRWGVAAMGSGGGGDEVEGSGGGYGCGERRRWCNHEHEHEHGDGGASTSSSPKDAVLLLLLCSPPPHPPHKPPLQHSPPPPTAAAAPHRHRSPRPRLHRHRPRS